MPRRDASPGSAQRPSTCWIYPDLPGIASSTYQPDTVEICMSVAIPQLAAWAAHSGLQTALALPARRFFHALDDPATVQQERLFAILAAVSGSRQVSRLRGFSQLRTALDFQDTVPLCTYDDLINDIEDIKRGVPGVLTRTPVLRFEKSGGSSGASKYIPHTTQLLGEFHAALAPWLRDIYRQKPAT